MEVKMTFLNITHRIIGLLICVAFIAVGIQAWSLPFASSAPTADLSFQIGLMSYLAWMITFMLAGLSLTIWGRTAWQLSLGSLVFYGISLILIHGFLTIFSWPPPHATFVDIYWLWGVPLLCFLDVILPPYAGRRFARIEAWEALNGR